MDTVGNDYINSFDCPADCMAAIGYPALVANAYIARCNMVFNWSECDPTPLMSGKLYRERYGKDALRRLPRYLNFSYKFAKHLSDKRDRCEIIDGRLVLNPAGLQLLGMWHGIFFNTEGEFYPERDLKNYLDGKDFNEACNFFNYVAPVLSDVKYRGAGWDDLPEGSLSRLSILEQIEHDPRFWDKLRNSTVVIHKRVDRYGRPL